MTVMAILQDADKCMRCNGCVTACKREWNLKLPTSMADVIPQKSIVSPRQRLAIKSLKRGDMGPFERFSCWHCPDPPCAYECPFGAIKKESTGAVSVDNSKCSPNLCKTGSGPKPCEIGCQRGGYPKVGVAYQTGPYAGQLKMNKCTLCTGRAGADGVVDPATALPTRARATSGVYPNQVFTSDLPLPSGGTLPNPTVPELAHEPACVSTCPAKAMKWDSKANILAYLNDPANGYTLANGTQNWIGNGAVFWASKKVMLTAPKADPFIEDHVAPMTSSAISNPVVLASTVLIGGLAMLASRKDKVAADESAPISEEV
jgi:Fe-S-cluster-containing dehydrogenase component